MNTTTRTRRASFLLWHLTDALLAIGAMAIAITMLAHHTGWRCWRRRCHRFLVRLRQASGLRRTRP